MKVLGAAFIGKLKEKVWSILCACFMSVREGGGYVCTVFKLLVLGP